MPDTDMHYPDFAAEFACSAAHFCSVVEKAETLTSLQFVERCAELLAVLYRDALLLPDVAPASGEPAPTVVSPERAAELRRVIDAKLGEYDHYWTVFDPFEDSEPVVSGLSDDVVDIYEDLKAGLALYRKGGASDVQDAIWQWRWGFNFHWGRHLVAALQPVHRLISGQLIDS